MLRVSLSPVRDVVVTCALVVLASLSQTVIANAGVVQDGTCAGCAG